jgi:hypothetical protein
VNWENFRYEEFACSHCGKNEMMTDVIDDLQTLRTALGTPFVITSGYRCPEHPIEAAKSAPGPHQTGRAVDIAFFGEMALMLVAAAMTANLEENELIWRGFGINQKGRRSSRFIHLDQCASKGDRRRPAIWSY